MTKMQNIIFCICFFGQFAVPIIFTIIFFMRRKKIIGESKNIYWKTFRHIVLASIAVIIILDIIILLYCLEPFEGSGNFGILFLPLFFIINLIISIIISVFASMIAKTL